MEQASVSRQKWADAEDRGQKAKGLLWFAFSTHFRDVFPSWAGTEVTTGSWLSEKAADSALCWLSRGQCAWHSICLDIG